MFLAKVKKRITATEKHPAFVGKRIYVVQPVLPDGTETGEEWIAADYLGSGVGNTVIVSAAPGGARDVFKTDRVPIRSLIVGIVDRIDWRDTA